MTGPHKERAAGGVTRDGEDIVVAIDRQMLAALQRQFVRGLAPLGDSSAQP